MIDIQICYDPMTVIPSDTEYVENELKTIEKDFNFIFIFDESEVDEKYPTLYVSNEGYFKAEVIDTEKIILKTSHLDLVLPSIIKTKELQKNQNKKENK